MPARLNTMFGWAMSLVLLLHIAITAAFGQADIHGPVILNSEQLTVTIDPASMGVEAGVAGGGRYVVSSQQPRLAGQVRVEGQPGGTVQCSYPERGLRLTAELQDNRLVMRFVSDRPGKVTWPIIPVDPKRRAFILPMFEGVYVPTDDTEWMQHLIDYGPMDTTADLSMPFVGLDHDDKTLTYIFDNIFDNQLVFERDKDGGQGVGASVTHTFRENWDTWEYTVVIELGEGSPIEPAKKYRAYLQERGGFVPMRDKIDANPKAERLLGASHAYLWDAGVFGYRDVTDWKAFCAKLIEEGDVDLNTPASTAENPAPLGRIIWFTFDDEAREAARHIVDTQWPGRYYHTVVAGAVSAFLENKIEHLANMNPREVAIREFTDHFGDLVKPADEWGEGVSVKMLNDLHTAGLDRMLLCMGDLGGKAMNPSVAQHADDLGYLFGHYDSYHSIHPPSGHPDYDADNTWATAQFYFELYETGGIVREDGTMSAGFKKVGYHLSPIAARPYIEARVDHYMRHVPYTTLFVDCDAFGQFFDDYHPNHTATKQDDMLERLDRMRWMNDAHGLVVGSEGGSAYAAPVIHYAHGMFTPVIGWGDPDLKDRESPYFKGRYWPPGGPETFVKQVPLKPKFKKFFYDPRYRLPLYQAVFHDSVVATHHWGNASLKFADQAVTVALLEQLYNVPPLYHLNPDEFKKHKAHILTHHAFFSPLHRDLALQPMTNFRWLSDDRLVQQTTFADGTSITANFTDQPTEIDGIPLPAHSVLAARPGGETQVYTPQTTAQQP